MAKKSMIAREKKRIHLTNKLEARRAELKKRVIDEDLSGEDRWQAECVHDSGLEPDTHCRFRLRGTPPECGASSERCNRRGRSAKIASSSTSRHWRRGLRSRHEQGKPEHS